MSRAMNMNQKVLVNALIIIMSMYVAFSIGSNNVANAAGPISTMNSNELQIHGEEKLFLIMILSVLMIAPGFAIGSSVFGSASLLLFASLSKGIPTSLVQLNVAAIIGVGVAKLGVKNIFRKTEVRKFFLMWLIAPIIAFVLCLSLLYIFDKLGHI